MMRMKEMSVRLGMLLSKVTCRKSARDGRRREFYDFPSALPYWKTPGASDPTLLIQFFGLRTRDII